MHGNERMVKSQGTFEWGERDRSLHALSSSEDFFCRCLLFSSSSLCVELHALINAIKRPIWWKWASSRLNMDQKWAAISLFNIAPAGSWTQDLLALIPYRTACSSQCDQKTDLMKETRQYIYTSTLCVVLAFVFLTFTVAHECMCWQKWFLRTGEETLNI
jgi:hypothetical protein